MNKTENINPRTGKKRKKEEKERKKDSHLKQPPTHLRFSNMICTKSTKKKTFYLWISLKLMLAIAGLSYKVKFCYFFDFTCVCRKDAFIDSAPENHKLYLREDKRHCSDKY